VGKFRAALLLLAVAVTADAQWKVDSAKSEPGRAGVTHRHISAQNPQTDGTVDLDVAVFSTRACTLRVIDNKDGANDLAAAVRRANAVAGVNGGYFDPNFAPIGLRVINGATTSSLVRARLITGVVLASARGVQIVRTAAFSRKQQVAAAIQCGPFLVEGGRAVRGLDNSRTARRTFVVTGGNDRAALGVCSEISLAQLSELLATIRITDDFKVHQALNLDGGSSTALWLDREGARPFSISEYKQVRDFVGVVPK
jgi:uncharacterized protein YigE (DUF2233 family)